MDIKQITLGIPQENAVTYQAAEKDSSTRNIVKNITEYLKIIIVSLKVISIRLYFSLKSKLVTLREKVKGVFARMLGRNRDEYPLKRSYKKVLKLAVLIVVVVAVILGIKLLSQKLLKARQTQVLSNQDVQGSIASVDLNKEFSFPLKDDKGKEISQIKYVIEKAELRNEIIVQGQKATAVSGRMFLIVYLKITNSYSQKVDMNTRNYVRLSVNGNDSEWLAPDIHNDPVEVQAQSTKYTRLGFPINANDNKMVLRVGDINGEKQNINLDFKR